jgi:hypothetical protein
MLTLNNFFFSENIDHIQLGILRRRRHGNGSRLFRRKFGNAEMGLGPSQGSRVRPALLVFLGNFGDLATNSITR